MIQPFRYQVSVTVLDTKTGKEIVSGFEGMSEETMDRVLKDHVDQNIAEALVNDLGYWVETNYSEARD